MYRVAGDMAPCMSMVPSLYVASGSWHVVMASILSVAGCFLRANGGCQTPCLVISACSSARRKMLLATMVRIQYYRSNSQFTLVSTIRVQLVAGIKKP